VSVLRHFDSFSETRSKLRSVLDAARQGLVTTVTRDNQRDMVVSADTFGEDLRRLLPSHAVVVHEGGGWAAFIPGAPVHGDAPTFDEAIDDLITALREYAEDWNDRLHTAPNHTQHRNLVRLVELSDDDQIRAWLLGQPRSTSAVAGVPART
jgi:hypothetical protein